MRTRLTQQHFRVCQLSLISISFALFVYSADDCKAGPVSSKSKSLPALEICECPTLLDTKSGQVPLDENYYNREQSTYDEALVDFIYVSRDEKEEDTEAAVNTTMIATTDNTPTAADTTTKELSTSTAREANDPNLPNGNSEEAIAQQQPDDDSADPLKATFAEFRYVWEQSALNAQDTGISDFLITQPQKVCAVPAASVQFQVENNCTALEVYPDVIAVPGAKHSYTVEGLLPEKLYRIEVRACVADLENGCGEAKMLFDATVSKNTEMFLKKIE